MNPREAFYGGRTGVTKLYHKIEKEEKIKYIDFTSLYPYINKYCTYPIGHPEVITQNFKPIQQYFGLVLCTVLPPHNLFHPVLPVRSNKKLIFGLCRTCIEFRTQTCNHSEEERSITGTWTTVEVVKALELGYELLALHEVYHFPSKSDVLFKKYIDMFLKIKQEASGWPVNCNTEEEKNSYIDNYYLKEGVKLNPRNIEKNPGRRAVAKLMLNSFWGKFGQNDHKTQTVMISSLADFNGYLVDKTKDVSIVISFYTCLQS